MRWEEYRETLRIAFGMIRSVVPRPRQVADRLPGFDLLRASLVFVMVGFHSGIGYMAAPVPGLPWLLRDQATSRAFDWYFWSMRPITMSLLFLVAGFFSAEVKAAAGTSVFLSRRCKRLLVPLVAGGLFVLPATVYIWAYGWFLSGRCTWREILALTFQPEIQQQLWGPAHLWFLEDLFLITLAFCGLDRLWSTLRGGRREGPAPWRPAAGWEWAALMMGTILTVIWRPELITTHLNSFIPDPARVIHYGLFFTAGVWLWGDRVSLGRLSRRATIYLACAVPFVIAIVLLNEGRTSLMVSNPDRLALGLASAAGTWLFAIGSVGLALRYRRQPNRALSYLMDADYWTYIVHIPILGLAQMALMDAPLPAVVKFLLVLTMVLAVSLSSYHAFVRFTFLGVWLHGSRPSPPLAMGSLAARAEQATNPL